MIINDRLTWETKVGKRILKSNDFEWNYFWYMCCKNTKAQHLEKNQWTSGEKQDGINSNVKHKCGLIQRMGWGLHRGDKCGFV